MASCAWAPLALRVLPREASLGGGVFEEAAVLLGLAGELGELLAGLSEIVLAGSEAVRQLGDTVAFDAVRAAMRSSSTADWLRERRSARESAGPRA